MSKAFFSNVADDIHVVGVSKKFKDFAAKVAMKLLRGKYKSRKMKLIYGGFHTWTDKCPAPLDWDDYHEFIIYVEE